MTSMFWLWFYSIAEMVDMCDGVYLRNEDTTHVFLNGLFPVKTNKHRVYKRSKNMVQICKGTVCFTGHRPLDLGGYEENPTQNWVRKALTTLIRSAIQKDYNLFISGGAIGVDQWAAEIVLEQGGHLTIARPFPSQSSTWPAKAQQIYDDILAKAHCVHDCSPDPYSVRKMHIRNEWMVDNSAVVIAVWTGKEHGGTYACIQYAKKKGKRICHVNPVDETIAWL